MTKVRKKKTFKITCYFCKDSLEFRAVDRQHISRACCKKEKCNSKLRSLKDRSDYRRYLAKVIDNFRNTSRNWRYAKAREAKVSMFKLGNDLYRLPEEKKIYIGRIEKESENDEYLTVRKGQDTQVVLYRKDIVRDYS